MNAKSGVYYATPDLARFYFNTPSDLALTGESSLFAHSRDVVVSLAESPAFSLEVLSHDADVILHAEGHTLRGRFEFAVNEEHGERSLATLPEPPPPRSGAA